MLEVRQVAQYELTEKSKHQAYNVVVNGISIDIVVGFKYLSIRRAANVQTLSGHSSHHKKASCHFTSILMSAVPLRN